MVHSLFFCDYNFRYQHNFLHDFVRMAVNVSVVLAELNIELDEDIIKEIYWRHFMCILIFENQGLQKKTIKRTSGLTLNDIILFNRINKNKENN